MELCQSRPKQTSTDTAARLAVSCACARQQSREREDTTEEALTTGPMVALSSKPSAMTVSFALRTSIWINLSYTVSCTYTRDPAVQSWPVLYRMPRATQFAAGDVVRISCTALWSTHDRTLALVEICGVEYDLGGLAAELQADLNEREGRHRPVNPTSPTEPGRDSAPS